MKPIPLVAAACWPAVASLSAQPDGRASFLSGNYQNGAFQSLTFVNPVVGWDTFFEAGFRGGSTVIGNIEAGHVWSGHESFIRPPGAVNGITLHNNTAAGALNEVDFHATMVGHVLAGSGYVPTNGGAYTYLGLGMAPEAALVSGAIATSFSSTEVGGFEITSDSAGNVYKSFFQGAGVAKPDVINSSWGGGDPSSSSGISLAIDGLARQNASVAFVVSAGNDGSDVVGAPASGFNNISVGSVGGADFRQPSSFSSRGVVDFYNPETGITLAGVRSAVDIAAPGERMFLAAYLGNSGGLAAAIPGIVEQTPSSDQYFYNMDGTSFAAPIVAGGIALLKDAAKTDVFFNHLGNDDAFDTRVIKSVLQASSTASAGWSNNRDGMNVTTQPLDPVTGAGIMDLNKAIDVYLLGTRELAVDGGGLIGENGWDAASIGLGQTFEYVFASAFSQEMALSVALNWFSVRDFDSGTDLGTDLAFSNLDLELWSVDEGGAFVSRVGASLSTYNNSEFLRFDSLDAGRYGFRVNFGEMVFDTTDVINSEYFGLAWNVMAVPEPGAMTLLLGGVAVMFRRRRA